METTTKNRFSSDYNLEKNITIKYVFYPNNSEIFIKNYSVFPIQFVFYKLRVVYVFKNGELNLPTR